MSMRRRGIVRLALRKLVRRCGVLGCIKLLGFAMERVALQIRVVFLLFEPVRCVRALFVARRDIARDGFAFGFCLRAFEDDKIAAHKLKGNYSLVSVAGSSSSPSPPPS